MPRKLASGEVVEARNAYARDQYMTYGVLAGRYGVSVACIRQAIRGLTYQDLPGKISNGDQRIGRRRGGRAQVPEIDIRNHRSWPAKFSLASSLARIIGKPVVILSRGRRLDVRSVEQFSRKSGWKVEELVKPEDQQE